jgi:hypothetical protein
MRASNYVYLDVQVIRQETPKAFQVVTYEGRLEWIPKSQVRDPEDFEAGDCDLTLEITDWIAKEKGLVAREPGEEG